MTIAITVDPTADSVRITMTGPGSVWFAFGFGNSFMANTYCFVASGGGNISEWKLGNHTAGSMLSESLMSSSYSSTGGRATAIVTRSISGMNSDYFTFPSEASTFTLIWGYGSFPNLGFHVDRGVAIITLREECPVTSSTISPTVCNNYLSPSGNYTWISSGTYMDTISNTAGCDSIITVNLSILTIDVSITQSNDTITANATGAMYQWLDCDNSYLPLIGETAQSLIAAAGGNYAVEIIENGCRDTSVCFNSPPTDVIENSMAGDLSIFPNPTKGMINIQIGSYISNFEIVILNTAGQIVGRSFFSNVNEATIEIDEGPGVYFIKLVSEDHYSPVFKVILQ